MSPPAAIPHSGGGGLAEPDLAGVEVTPLLRSGYWTGRRYALGRGYVPVDPASFGLGWLLTALGKPFLKAMATQLGQHAGTLVGRSFQSAQKVHTIGGTRELKELVSRGEARPGHRVKGTGYFSLLTPNAGGVPMQMATLAAAVMAAVGGQNSPRHFYPASSFPLIAGGLRIGFLYPHDLWGFGEVMMPRGRPEPCHMGVPLLLREGEWVGLENRIVRINARLEFVLPEDFESLFGILDQELYDFLARKGALHFLNASPSDCSVEEFEAPQNEVLLGVHHFEAHWDREKIPRRNEFEIHVDQALKKACEELALPVPQSFRNQVQKGPAVTWLGHDFQALTAYEGPLVSIQVNVDLKAERSDALERLATLRAHVFELLEPFAHDATNDLDVADTFHQGFTVLDSPEAREIQRPEFAAVRAWIQRNYTAKGQ